MAQVLLRQKQSSPKDGTPCAEVVKNDHEHSISGTSSAPVLMLKKSPDDAQFYGEDDQEPAVRRWQDLIIASLAPDERARESGRWQARQSWPFFICLSAVSWVLLIFIALRVLQP